MSWLVFFFLLTSHKLESGKKEFQLRKCFHEIAILAPWHPSCKVIFYRKGFKYIIKNMSPLCLFWDVILGRTDCSVHLMGDLLTQHAISAQVKLWWSSFLASTLCTSKYLPLASILIYSQPLAAWSLLWGRPAAEISVWLLTLCLSMKGEGSRAEGF